MSETTIEPVTLQLPELGLGERYAGPVLDVNGNVKHQLILMAARPASRLTWKAAMDWATSVDGSLPDRQEQALLYANCKPHMKPNWTWSSETYDPAASFAWFCNFFYGYQSFSHKSFQGCAIAVRRV